MYLLTQAEQENLRNNSITTSKYKFNFESTQSKSLIGYYEKFQKSQIISSIKKWSSNDYVVNFKTDLQTFLVHGIGSKLPELFQNMYEVASLIPYNYTDETVNKYLKDQKVDLIEKSNNPLEKFVQTTTSLLYAALKIIEHYACILRMSLIYSLGVIDNMLIKKTINPLTEGLNTKNGDDLYKTLSDYRSSNRCVNFCQAEMHLSTAKTCGESLTKSFKSTFSSARSS